MNYLQYIGSVHHTTDQFPQVRFLVSGIDALVKQVVCQNIVTSTYNNEKTLFIVDNTISADTVGNKFGHYNTVNILSGDVSLCDNLLDVKSLKGISRLRALLSDLGFDGTRAMKVVTYLIFVKETEAGLGNDSVLTVDILEQYGSTMLVEWKLNQLVEASRIDETTYRYLLGRYSEVSEAAADFEMFLVLLSPFLGNNRPTASMAVYLPVGEFSTDRPMQDMLCKLLVSYVKQNSDNSAVLIIDDGNCENRSFIVDVIKNIPITAEVHMISNDVFSLGENDRGVVMNSFSVKIYTRHENMTSCSKIEEYCGQIDVVKRSSTIAVDKRFKANSAWDLLMGTNRTETEILNAPTKESLYRKEMINSLMEGTGIIDCGGNKVLFNFLGR